MHIIYAFSHLAAFIAYLAAFNDASEPSIGTSVFFIFISSSGIFNVSLESNNYMIVGGYIEVGTFRFVIKFETYISLW